VQVIALLCALFEKTGTGNDLKKIRERNQKVSKHLRESQKRRDEALYRGEVVQEDIHEWDKTLDLSPWHPVIIIVRPTLLSMWEQSFEMFAHFSISIYSSEKKTQATSSIRHGLADILLCPASLFQKDDHFQQINLINWKLVIIDEFHKFKAQTSKVSNRLRDLKYAHKPLVLGMTGTLMQNNHDELWNLCDLVQTNYLGTKEEFAANVNIPITIGR
jgi:SNF2 family DNA or RNA helicase